MVYFSESHNLRKKALKSIDQTTFYPDKGKARIRAMIETRLTGVFLDRGHGEFLTNFYK